LTPDSWREGGSRKYTLANQLEQGEKRERTLPRESLICRTTKKKKCTEREGGKKQWCRILRETNTKTKGKQGNVTGGKYKCPRRNKRIRTNEKRAQSPP